MFCKLFIFAAVLAFAAASAKPGFLSAPIAAPLTTSYLGYGYGAPAYGLGYNYGYGLGRIGYGGYGLNYGYGRSLFY